MAEGACDLIDRSVHFVHFDRFANNSLTQFPSNDDSNCNQFIFRSRTISSLLVSNCSIRKNHSQMLSGIDRTDRHYDYTIVFTDCAQYLDSVAVYGWEIKSTKRNEQHDKGNNNKKTATYEKLNTSTAMPAIDWLTKLKTGNVILSAPSHSYGIVPAAVA